MYKDMHSSASQQFFKLRPAGSDLTRRALRERQRLLHLIHTTWIEGLLEPSLATTPYIPLHLRQWSSAASNQPDQESTTVLLLDTSMLDIFDQAGGQLLILGESCAGKTTLLLELLRDLLQRAEQDEHSPIPVVLNLSSWAIESPPLEKWLAEELETKYQLDRTWFTRSLLLLDGLDQVQENEREACLQAKWGAGSPCRGLGCPQKTPFPFFLFSSRRRRSAKRGAGSPCRGLGCPQLPLFFSRAGAGGLRRVSE